MRSDPGTQWLLADARRLGLSIRQYESQFNIVLAPQEQAIAEQEVALGDLPLPATGHSSDPASFVPYDDEHMVRYDDAGTPRTALVNDVQLQQAALLLKNSRRRPRPAQLRERIGLVAPPLVKGVA